MTQVKQQAFEMLENISDEKVVYVIKFMETVQERQNGNDGYRITASEKAEQDRRDLEIINRNADRLNREAADALQYQVDLF